MRLIVLIFTYFTIVALGLYDYQPSGNVKLFIHYDKLIHFSEYFILGILYLNALNHQDFKIKMLYPLLFISLIPIIDESIQIFVPNRIASIYDAFFDYLGCYIGMGLYYLIYRYKNG